MPQTEAQKAGLRKAQEVRRQKAAAAREAKAQAAAEDSASDVDLADKPGTSILATWEQASENDFKKVGRPSKSGTTYNDWLSFVSNVGVKITFSLWLEFLTRGVEVPDDASEELQLSKAERKAISEPIAAYISQTDWSQTEVAKRVLATESLFGAAFAVVLYASRTAPIRANIKQARALYKEQSNAAVTQSPPAQSANGHRSDVGGFVDTGVLAGGGIG